MNLKYLYTWRTLFLMYVIMVSMIIRSIMCQDAWHLLIFGFVNWSNYLVFLSPKIPLVSFYRSFPKFLHNYHVYPSKTANLVGSNGPTGMSVATLLMVVVVHELVLRVFFWGQGCISLHLNVSSNIYET